MANNKNHVTSIINQLAAAIANDSRSATEPVVVLIREPQLDANQQPSVRVTYYPLTGVVSRLPNGSIVLEVAKDNKRVEIEQLTPQQQQIAQVQGMLPPEQAPNKQGP